MKPVYYSTPDHELEIAQKLELIKGIEYWQGERWKRMVKFHNMHWIPQNIRHVMMQNEIELMREQRTRLLNVKQSILQ